MLWRSFRSRHQLRVLANRTGEIRADSIVAVVTLRNEMTRLPWFLEYYRRIGIGHFLIVDNGSDDGSVAFLTGQPDVSLWQTQNSYRNARFGLDWMTWLQMRYAHRKWCLMVDADELLVFAHHENRTLRDLATWLERLGRTAFGAHMLDLYPKGQVGTQTYTPGTDPLETLQWFDASEYRASRQQTLGNLWVQGGVRERAFFTEDPRKSPTLNKIPFVKWDRKFAYVNSCHSALPKRLNFEYDGPGGTAPSGVLLHTKFLPEIVSKSAIEKRRGQHFHSPSEFGLYYDHLAASPDLWTPQSVKYRNWRQLEQLGLMSSGGWLP